MQRLCRFWKEVLVARCKAVDPHLSRVLPVRFSGQVLTGKELFAVDGCKPLSNASPSRTRTGGRLLQCAAWR